MKFTTKQSDNQKRLPINLINPKQKHKLPQVTHVIKKDNQIFLSLQKFSMKLKNSQSNPFLPRLSQKQNAQSEGLRKILNDKKVPIKLIPLSSTLKSTKLSYLSKSTNSSLNKKKDQKKSIFSNSMFINSIRTEEKKKNFDTVLSKQQTKKNIQICEEGVQSQTFMEDPLQKQNKEQVIVQNFFSNIIGSQNSTSRQRQQQLQKEIILKNKQKAMNLLFKSQQQSQGFYIKNLENQNQEQAQVQFVQKVCEPNPQNTLQNSLELMYLEPTKSVQKESNQGLNAVSVINITDIPTQQQITDKSSFEKYPPLASNLLSLTAPNRSLQSQSTSLHVTRCIPLHKTLASMTTKFAINDTQSDWFQTIQELKKSIGKINDEQSLVKQQIWTSFCSMFKKYHLNQQQKYDLFSLFLHFLNVNYGNQQVDDELAFCGQMGIKMLKLQTNVHFKHKQCIQNLSFLLNEDKTETPFPILFHNLQFIMKTDQVQKVAIVVERLCANNIDAFAFLSLYLQISVSKKLKLQPFREIQKQLASIIQFLQTKYPASQVEEQINKHFQNKQSLYEVQKVVQTVCGIQTTPFDHKYDVLKFVEDSNDQNSSHFNQLKDYVIQKAEFAQKDKVIFLEIVKHACVQKGYGFKSDLKVKSKKSSGAIFRVIQKLLGIQKFKARFEKFKQERLANTDQKLKYFQNGLLDLVAWEKQEVEQQIKKILQKQKQISFTLHDMVRGKCKFNTVQEIQQTVVLLKKRIQSQQNVKIIQVQNRLNWRTKDVVIILGLPNSVAELQLALKQDTVLNQFNHKIYQIKRSKIYGNVSNLCLHNQGWGEMFFTEQMQILFEMLTTSPDQNFQQSYSFADLQQAVRNFTQQYLKPNGVKFQTEGLQRIRMSQKIQQKLNQVIQTIGKGYNSSVDKYQRIQNQQINSIMFYFKNQDLDKAYEIIQEIPDEQLEDDLVLLRLKCDLLREKQMEKQAIECYIKYINLQKEQNGDDTDDLANAYIILGQIYFQNKQFLTAIKYYEKCIQIKEKLNGNNCLQLTLVYNKMGNLHRNMGKYPVALQFYQQSLQIIENTVGKQSTNAAQTLSGIGSIHHSKADYNEALKYYKMSQQTFEKIKGKVSLEVSALHNNIGTIYRDLGYKEKAYERYIKALSINQKIKGKQSIEVAQIYNNLGLLYQNALEYNKALQMYQICLQIRQKLKDQENVVIAETYFNLGNLYSAKKEYQKATEYLKKSLQIKSVIQGTQSIGVAQVMHSMGVNYKNMNNPNAIHYYKKSLQITERIKGSECIDSANININIGMLYEEAGSYEKARQYYQKGLSIQQKIRGTDNIDVALTYYNISLLYTKMKLWNEAYKYAERAHNIWMHIYKEKHEHTILAGRQLQYVKKGIELQAQKKRKMR